MSNDTRQQTRVHAPSHVVASRARAGGLLPTPALVALDVALIQIGFVVAWYLRYVLQLGREVAAENFLPLGSYLGVQAILTAALLVVYRLNGTYSRHRRRGWIDQVSGIGGGTLVGIAAIIIFVFYARPFSYSRLIFVYEFLVITGFLTLARTVERLWLDYRRRRGIGLLRIIVVGEGPLARMIMQNIVAQPELGYQIIGFVDDEPRDTFGRFPYLGTCRDIPRLVWEYQLDEVVIALPSASHVQITEILIACAKKNVKFRIVPDFYELSLNQVDITDVNGIPLIGLRGVSMPSSQQALKRAIDIALALLGIIGTSWLMLIIAALVKLTSAGPVIITQQRVGRHGKIFGFYKFRSMRATADKELVALLDKNEVRGPVFKMKQDPRITPIGRWMRRFSLDELPQLFNVLRGEMSLVGPRPPFPWEVERYEEWHRRRLEATPGMTGLWQVSGRSDLPFDEMALLDIWYIENWSLGLDAKILLRSVPAVLTGHGAY